MKINDINTGDFIGEVSVLQESELDTIMNISYNAFLDWKCNSLEDRLLCVEKFKQLLLDNADEIGKMISKEMGKPISESVGEVKFAANSIDEKLETAKKAFTDYYKEDELINTKVLHKPLGVSVIISPWNFPILMLHNMLIPSLLAGNSVVLKPSEKTPLSAQKYIQLLSTVLPRNVVQVVFGYGELGAALVKHPKTKLVAFTGSEQVGKCIMKDASENLTRVILELGGKDPLIVMEDADLDKAVELAVINSFRNAGQVCVSTERVYVHSSLKKEFERRVVDKVSSMTIGNSMDSVDIGPMSSKMQKDEVLKQLDNSRGCFRFLINEKIEKESNYLNPIVITDVTNECEIFQKETFGPVMAIREYSQESVLINEVNDSKYGLGAIIFSKDVKRAYELAEKLEVGMIGINKRCNGASGTSWVGAKNSGYSYHGDVDGYRNFSQKRLISVEKIK